MPQRQFLDSHGRTWTVWNVDPARVASELDAAWRERHASAASEVRPRATLPRAMSAGWLCFQHADEKRRLAPAPRLWDRLTSSELESLCSRATTVSKVTTTTAGELRPA